MPELSNKSNTYNIRNMLGNVSQNIDMGMSSAHNISVGECFFIVWILYLNKVQSLLKALVQYVNAHRRTEVFVDV